MNVINRMNVMNSLIAIKRMNAIFISRMNVINRSNVFHILKVINVKLISVQSFNSLFCIR